MSILASTIRALPWDFNPDAVTEEGTTPQHALAEAFSAIVVQEYDDTDEEDGPSDEYDTDHAWDRVMDGTIDTAEEALAYLQRVGFQVEMDC